MVPLVTGHCAQALSSQGPMAAPRALHKEPVPGYKRLGRAPPAPSAAELSWETIRPLGMTCTLVKRHEVGKNRPGHLQLSLTATDSKRY